MRNSKKALFLNSVLILSLSWVETWAIIERQVFNSDCLSCGRPAYQHLDLELDVKCNYYPDEAVFEISNTVNNQHYTLDHKLVMRALRMIDKSAASDLNLSDISHWRIKRAYWSIDQNMLDPEIAQCIVNIGLFAGE